MISIREETQADLASIRTLNELAFGRPEEAKIIDRLRDACDELLSLVAVDGDEIVGHILFSPVTVRGRTTNALGMGLAPMAVLPDRQRQGIGSAMVRQGLARLARSGCPFVIVLGHAAYYPRFGFERASRHGIQSQWPGIPDDVFMVAILDPAAFEGVRGVAQFRDEFDEGM
jgi:putative acetyltransferase